MKWILAVLCLVAALVAWRLMIPRERDIAENADSALQVVQRVQVTNTAEYREFAEKRVPLILERTIADRWPAREAFSTRLLAGKLHHVLAHKQEERRCFMTFHDDKPLEPLVSQLKWEDFNLKINTTIPEILQWNHPQKRSQTGPYMYYSQDISTLREQFPDVIGYVQPIKPLILSEDHVQVNLWVGREGLVTHTHYDCTYNFFVQLQGRKRFTLFPPTQPLYLYPCLHPHYGHSQVNILQPDMNTFSKYSSEGGFVAEVSAGDMLVVPPFWFHHVETLSESVSVNVWSDAPEYALLDRIYSLPVPFEEEWAWQDLLVATKLYLDMVTASLVAGPPSLFVRSRLLEQRYNSLVSSNSLAVNDTILCSLREECSHIDWRIKEEHFERILRPGVENLEQLFKTIPTRDTMEICLANYMEHLIHRVLGIHYVYPFLSTCALNN